MFKTESKANEQKLESRKQAYKDWAKSNPQEQKQLEKFLRDKGVEEKQIPIIMEKVMPIAFGLYLNPGEKQIGVGAGIGYPIELGKAGTLMIGAGAMVGKLSENVGVGVGTGVGYESPKLGRFSIVAGVGVGTELSEKGATLPGLYGSIGLKTDISWSNKYKVELTGGVAAGLLGGVVPGILPGALLSIHANHEILAADEVEIGLKVAGFDLIDQATDPQLMAKKIGENQYLASSIERAYGVSFNKLRDAEITLKYREIRHNFINDILINYKPQPGSDITVGIGFDPTTGKFVFGVGGAINQTTGKEQLSAGSQSEMDVEQNFRQMGRINRQAGQKFEEILREEDGKAVSDNPQIKKWLKTGKLIMTEDGPAFRSQDRNEPTTQSPKEQKEIASIKDLAARLNQIYAPLKMSVEFNQELKMFELKLLDQNDETNYNIAVDRNMKGGVVFKDGKIFLASPFEKNNSLTLRRSNFEYPLAKEGRHFHSLITISDSPLTPSHVVYNNATHLLIADGKSAWRGPVEGRANYAATKPLGIHTEYKSEFQMDEARFKETVDKKPENSTEFTSNYENFVISAAEAGKVDAKKQAEIKLFAKNFLAKNPLVYRKLSNAESDTKEYKQLNTEIIKNWRERHNGAEPTPAELSVIRIELMDQSFSELGNKPIEEPTPTEKIIRQMSFKERLDATVESVLKPQVRKIVARNQQKYPENDPRRISMSDEDLVRTIKLRIKTVDVNSDTGAVLLKDIEKSNTVAATLGVLGLRGGVAFSDDTDTGHKMIGTSENYADKIATDPKSFEANMSRLIIESLNPEIPQEITSGADARKLLNSDLALKITEQFNIPETKFLFSTPEVRDEIMRLESKRNNPNMDDIAGNKSEAAFRELQELISGIRQAELRGEKYYQIPRNPDFRFRIDLDIHDGVYKKCTNYSFWMNEGLVLEQRVGSTFQNFEGYAAVGEATASVTSKAVQQITKWQVAGVAVAPPPTPAVPVPPVPGAQVQSAGEVGSTKVEGGHTDPRPNITPPVTRPAPPNSGQ